MFLLSGGELLGQPSTDRNMRQTRCPHNPAVLRSHPPHRFVLSPPHNIALSRCAVTSGRRSPRGSFCCCGKISGTHFDIKVIARLAKTERHSYYVNGARPSFPQLLSDSHAAVVGWLRVFLQKEWIAWRRCACSTTCKHCSAAH